MKTDTVPCRLRRKLNNWMDGIPAPLHEHRAAERDCFYAWLNVMGAALMFLIYRIIEVTI